MWHPYAVANILRLRSIQFSPLHDTTANLPVSAMQILQQTTNVDIPPEY